MTELEQKTKQLKKKLRLAPLTKEWLEQCIISLGLYGRVSGVIGPYIIANSDGKIIIRLRPKDFKMSQTHASITNRKSMAAVTKYAMFLKSITPLYETWMKAKVTGNNAFTRIIKHNKKLLINNSPSLLNTITPDGFKIYIENAVTVQRNGKIKVLKDSADQGKMIIVLAAFIPKTSSDFELISSMIPQLKPGRQ